MITVAIACDHAGLSLKQALLMRPYAWLDIGVHTSEPSDYPDVANELARALLEKKAQLGVLICGTGIGMSIAANRHTHIRAALCHTGLMSRLARQHNDANVLILGARIIGSLAAEECVDVFLSTTFEGGRHQRRIDKLTP